MSNGMHSRRPLASAPLAAITLAVTPAKAGVHHCR